MKKHTLAALIPSILPFVTILSVLLATCSSPTGPTPPVGPGTLTVPGIPQTLAINTDGDGNSTLAWTAVSEANSYRVYHSETKAGVYSELTSTPGTSYLLPFYGWYKVSAVNAAGEGSKSAEVERVPQGGDPKADSPRFLNESDDTEIVAGSYNEALSIKISLETGGTALYYTIDGTVPEVGNAAYLYGDPISVTAGQTVTITAIASGAVGFSNSNAAVGTFQVKGWEMLGSAGFSGGEAFDISLALDGSGNPYVAYRDGSVSNKATVMKYGASSWSALGGTGISAAGAYYTSLALDSLGAVYLAYYDASVSGKITVRKNTGASWTTLGTAGFSGGEALFPSLAVDNSGPTPVSYVAYQDGGTIPPAKASVQKYSVTPTPWTYVGMEGFSSGIIYATSLAIGSVGNPFLAFIDSSSGTKLATVMKWDGSSWSLVGPAGFSSGEISYISLVLDSEDTPYVAYSGGVTNPSVKATVVKWNGTSWASVGSGAASTGAADFVRLAIDADDTLYVAYKDAETVPPSKATVMRYNGLSWDTIGPAGFSSGTADYLSLAAGSAGTIIVAFKDGDTISAGKATVMIWR